MRHRKPATSECGDNGRACGTAETPRCGGADATSVLSRRQVRPLKKLTSRFLTDEKMVRHDHKRQMTDPHQPVFPVVSRLPQSPPDYTDAWETVAQADSGEIRVFYKLPVIPPGISGWFLARSRRFATRLIWRGGALLRHPDGAHAAPLRTHADRV